MTCPGCKKPLYKLILEVEATQEAYAGEDGKIRSWGGIEAGETKSIRCAHCGKLFDATGVNGKLVPRGMSDKWKKEHPEWSPKP